MVPISPRSPRAAQRSSATGSQASAPRLKASLKRDWQRESLATSIKAFTVPSLLAPLLLPPQWQHLRFFSMGLVLCEQRQQKTVRYVPAPDKSGELTAQALALLPFVPALALHGKLNHMLAMRGPAGASLDAAWTRFADRFPSVVRPVLRRYPLTAMLSLVPLQVLASVSGATISSAWHVRQGRRLAEQPARSGGLPISTRVVANPAPWVGSLLPFALPAALASAAGRRFLGARGLGAAGTSGTIALSAILAAMTPLALASRGPGTAPGTEANNNPGGVR